MTSTNDEGTPRQSAKTFRVPARAAAVAAIAGALLIGATACGPSNAGPAANAAATATASASTTVLPTQTGSSTATASVSAPAAVQETAKWQHFTSADGKVSFDYPAGWTVALTPGASSGLNLDVTDADGMKVASLNYGAPNGGLGGACGNPVPYSVLDSTELALPYNTAAADTITPRFTFRALQEAGRVTASYGITSSVAGKEGKSCMFYNVVSGPSDSPFYSFADAVQVNTEGKAPIGNRKGAKVFTSMDEARAYMTTPEYADAKRMITSLTIKAR